MLKIVITQGQAYGGGQVRGLYDRDQTNKYFTWLGPSSIKTEVLGNPSLTSKRFHETRKISWDPKDFPREILRVEGNLESRLLGPAPSNPGLQEPNKQLRPGLTRCPNFIRLTTVFWQLLVTKENDDVLTDSYRPLQVCPNFKLSSLNNFHHHHYNQISSLGTPSCKKTLFFFIKFINSR